MVLHVHIEWLLCLHRSLFSGLELHVRYVGRVMATNMDRSLFPIQHLCILTHTKLENYRSYMDVVHIKWLFYYWRHSSCVLDWHERSDWRVMAPDMQCSHSLIQYCMCVYCKPMRTCTLIFDMQLQVYAWQQNSWHLWLYYTLNDGFNANNESF